MERLHKFLAHCGVASRRKAEEIILEGRVAINGDVVDELGVKIDPEKDYVTVDGKTVHQERKTYLLLHKPKGYTTTAEDEYGRKTVLDLVPPEISQRVYPAGRLDRESEGLIVLTNDGDLSYYLTHPSQGVRKVYEVTVIGRIEDSVIRDLIDTGVRIGPVLVKPSFCKVARRSKERTTLKIGVSEGVNREVRRLFAILGHEVKRLVRLEVGPFTLKGIPKGKCRKMSKAELDRVFELMNNPSEAKMEVMSKLKRRYSGSTSRPSGKPDPARPQRYSGINKLKKKGASSSRGKSSSVERFGRGKNQGDSEEKLGRGKRQGSSEERIGRGKRPKRGERTGGGAGNVTAKKVTRKKVDKKISKKPAAAKKHPLA